MRITNTTIARNYTSNLNMNLSRLDASTNKAMTARRFNSMSENTALGVRSMNVRRSLSQLNGYLDNAKTANNMITGAEKNLMKISDLSKDISDKYIVAINGDNSKAEREIIATELEKLRDEILNCANGQYSDRFLFGGTNTQTTPFTTEKDATGNPVLDANGNPILYYNGVKVTDINKGDPAFDYLFKDAGYVDIGLGMTMQSNPNNQSVISNSAFKTTLVGLDFLGSGSENLYNIVNDMITSLRAPSFDPVEGGKILERFKTSADSVGLALTKLGSDTQYLDFTVSRLEAENDNLIKQQDTLEFMDPAEAIMDWKMQEYVYNAALQMGARLLQPSLFNFIK